MLLYSCKVGCSNREQNVVKEFADVSSITHKIEQPLLLWTTCPSVMPYFENHSQVPSQKFCIYKYNQHRYNGQCLELRLITFKSSKGEA